MVVRKLIKVGGSHYVALPKQWIRGKGLEDDGHVMLEMLEDGSIRITPSLRRGEASPRAKRIVAREGVGRLIMAAYLEGYEILEIMTEKRNFRDVLNTIERIQSILLGIEVVEEREDRIVVECFTKPDYNLKSLMYRMDSISRGMYTDSIRAFEEADSELARSVIRRDDKLDRIYFLSVRTIRTKIVDPAISGQQRLRLLDYRLLAKYLEEIGDIAEEIANLVGSRRRRKALYPIAMDMAKIQRRLVERLLEYRFPSLAGILRDLREIDYRIEKSSSSLRNYHRDVAIELSLVLRKLVDIADLATP